MDHSFKDRVDKIFGSISSSSSSSSSSTPWSLTDAQVERRVWNRDKGDKRDDDQTPVSSSFHNCQTKDDEWDIRSSIGLDATLDNEEEEDAYDKMAEGREDAGDRLYMKDVTDHGPYLNSHNILPSSLHDVKKDPRANHDAAKTRLKEDNDVVGIDQVMLNAEEPCVTGPASEDGIRIKSILKRKNDDHVVKPPAKRVRFDSTCKNDDEITQLQGFGLPKVASGSVPDYILNPSKYTRYSIDEFSHDANTEAYLDFLEQVNNSKDVESTGDMPKSVLFIPKKKSADGEAAACNNNDKQSSAEAAACNNNDKQSSAEAAACNNNDKQSSETSCHVGIAVVAVQQGEISQEDADDAVCTKARSQKQGRRQYRTKMEADDDDV